MENNRRGGNGRRTSFSGEKRSFSGERKSFSGDRKPFSGERKSFSGERRSFGEGRNFGDRKPFGTDRPRRNFSSDSAEGRGFSNDGERRSFSGDRKPFSGERKSFGERRSFGEGRNFGDRKPFSGERKSFSGERRNSGEGRSFGERKSFGGSRNFGDRKPFAGRRNSRPGFGNRDMNYFRNEDESGISRMISRRPQVDNGHFSDNDTVKTPIKDEIRLNKFIANSGVCSRREADNFILAGVVTVNGEVITELGTKVNINTDDIRFNGERLKGEGKVYIIMNKPKGFVTTASDPHADKTVMDLIKGCPARVFPVGRLDKNTTGVLMFTNDGEIAEKLTHPSYDKKKIYQVSLDSKLKQEDYEKILKGVELTDGVVAADELEYIEDDDHRKIGIEIHSGKNRIVRRIFESLGYEVKALDRVYFAGLTKKGLKRGEWRYLSEGETNLLKMGAYL